MTGVLLARTLRLLTGFPLAWAVAIAVASPQVSRSATIGALLIAIATLWRPSAGLLLTAVLTPAGALLAAAPARGAELLAWAFLAAWLLRLWQPLSRSTWPRAIVVPALLYMGTLAGSWVTLMIRAAPGVPVTALPFFLARSIRLDHLVFPVPDAATWTLLQSAAGIGILLAAVGVARSDARFPWRLAAAIAVSTAVLALLTLGDVIRQSAAAASVSGFLMRYINGERFSLHMADVNAAGSLYALGALAAAGLAAGDRARRTAWVLLALLMAPAAWLTGSRTSVVAFGAGLLLGASQITGWRPSRMQKHLIAATAVVLVGVALVTGDWSGEVRGTAARAVGLRTQFTQSTLRMFASAPVSGVGIGQYFNRSAEFFTPELRALYVRENAHNYFAQQFAELGITGGTLFLWLVIALLVAGWRAIRQHGGDGLTPSASLGAAVGLFAGSAAYLLTCVTGHPLLVPEATFSFWAALGVTAGFANPPHTHGRSPVTVLATMLAVVLVAANAGRAVDQYRRVDVQPSDDGLHEAEMTEDGTSFRWMTRHAVTYMPASPGFIRLHVRAPARGSEAQLPFVLETLLGGRLADRRELPFGQWVTFDVAAYAERGMPFRRVDLWLNQFSTEPVTLGRRAATRPIGVMVGSVKWVELIQ